MVDVLIDTEILRGFPIAMVDHRRVPYMNGRMTVQNVRLFDVKSRVPGFLWPIPRFIWVAINIAVPAMSMLYQFVWKLWESTILSHGL